MMEISYLHNTLSKALYYNNIVYYYYKALLNEIIFQRIVNTV